MRHGAVTYAADVRERVAGGETWDVLFCSDMLNLAEFRGLAPVAVRALPTVVYFHENQLTYPFRYFGERDFHFGFTNMTTALAADEVWFNTAFHRDDYLAALRDVLKRMPDYQSLEVTDQIRAKARVEPPGVEMLGARESRTPGPMGIVWAARWEHDKNPEGFFAAIEQLEVAGVDFRVSVVGEEFRESPAIFAQARERFAARIDRWGYQPTRADYVAALREADVFVSTAEHEFFGISAVEAIAAGCYPLLPKRLAYPELLELDTRPEREVFFYDGSVDDLVRRLRELGGDVGDGWRVADCEALSREIVQRFGWEARAREMDGRLEELVRAAEL